MKRNNMHVKTQQTGAVEFDSLLASLNLTKVHVLGESRVWFRLDGAQQETPVEKKNGSK